jgi:hypothetical protein
MCLISLSLPDEAPRVLSLSQTRRFFNGQLGVARRGTYRRTVAAR